MRFNSQVMKRVMGMDRMDPPPEVVKKFLEANEVSSHQLRAEAGITPAEAGAKGGDGEKKKKQVMMMISYFESRA